MSETGICMCCNSLFSEENPQKNFVCQTCHLKWVEFRQRESRYKKAFEEIQFSLLELEPSYENIRDARDTANRILEEF